MALKVAVQMDPIETVNIDADSTFALMLEAQARGHALWHYDVRHMSLREGVARQGGRRTERLTARARPVTVARVQGAHWRYGDAVLLDLATFDVVLMRQDPPFDMAYITATHMLEHIQPGTVVVNDPAAVRNAPEKILVTRFPDLMPPTMISWDMEAIRAFRAEHRDIIVKPLFGNGGAGVFRIKPDDENLGALLEMHFARSREPLMFQRYEPAVRRGDKRIILIDGEAMGAVNRVPAEGEARSNMHVGGRAERTVLTARDREICDAIGPTLREQGMIFVGIDVIGDWLTEINVTSPTGIQEIARLDGVHLERAIWDSIEAKAVDRSEAKAVDRSEAKAVDRSEAKAVERRPGAGE
jgi:glutathione synthase